MYILYLTKSRAGTNMFGLQKYKLRDGRKKRVARVSRIIISRSNQVQNTVVIIPLFHFETASFLVCEVKTNMSLVECR